MVTTKTTQSLSKLFGFVVFTTRNDIGKKIEPGCCVRWGRARWACTYPLLLSLLSRERTQSFLSAHQLVLGGRVGWGQVFWDFAPAVFDGVAHLGDSFMPKAVFSQVHAFVHQSAPEGTALTDKRQESLVDGCWAEQPSLLHETHITKGALDAEVVEVHARNNRPLAAFVQIPYLLQGGADGLRSRTV